MIVDIILSKYGVLFLVGMALFLWEYFFDFRHRQEKRVRHLARNLAFSFVGSLVVGTLYAGALVLAHSKSLDMVPTVFSSNAVPSWAVLIILFLLFDVVLYFWHRANHAAPLLWRFHRVHHSDRDLDFSSAMRFHVGELLLSLGVKMIFVFVTGTSPVLIAVFDLFVTLFAMFNHSNISLRRCEPFVRRLIVTPSMHRVHHSEIQAETDSNFCTMLSVWDYVFRTLHFRQDQKRITIGLTQYPSVEKLTLKELFVIPFR